MTALADNRDLSTPEAIVEGATGLPASRRAGNLWTTEARDDMFNRRERGEGWESICQDYPNRSRHAMQQQYSMMKKQRMMAEGTWTNNRRGRKRKIPQTPGAAVGLRRDFGLETTEDETQSVTLSDLDPDDPDDMAVDGLDLGTPAPESNGSSAPSQSVLDFRPSRPSGLGRSATDPVSAPRGRGRGRGRMASSYTHGDSSHPPLAPKGFTPVNEDRDVKPNKRSLLDNATPPAPKRQKSQGEAPTPDALSDMKVPSSETSCYFSKEDLLEFFRKGIENSTRARKMLEDDAAFREKAFQDAQGRANRRAYEAEERIKESGYRHRSDIREVEHNNALKMENMQADYEQKISELTKQLAIARGVDPKTIEIAPPAPQALPVANGMATEAQDSSVESKQLVALVTNLEELKARFETERELRKKAEQRATAAAQERMATTLQSLAPEFLGEFQHLEAMVTKLHSEAGDLAPSAMAKALSEIRARCAQCASRFRPQSHTTMIQQQQQQPAPPPPPPQQQQQQQAHLQQHQQQQQQQQHAQQQQRQQQHALPPHLPHENRSNPPMPMNLVAQAQQMPQPLPPPPPPHSHPHSHPHPHPHQGMHPDVGHHPPPSYSIPPGGHPSQVPYGPHFAPMPSSGSPSPSPMMSVKPHEGHHSRTSSHQGLPTPAEQPFDNMPFEPKRSTPVTIHQLLHQEPAIAPISNLPPPRHTASSPPYDLQRPPPPTIPGPLSAPLPAPMSGSPTGPLSAPLSASMPRGEHSPASRPESAGVIGRPPNIGGAAQPPLRWT